MFYLIESFRSGKSPLITSHFLNVPQMLEYLRIFFPIFFALNQQKKRKLGCVMLKALFSGLLGFFGGCLRMVGGQKDPPSLKCVKHIPK